MRNAIQGSRKSRDLLDLAILLNVLVVAWDELRRSTDVLKVPEFRLPVRMAMVRRLLDVMQGGERNPEILRYHAMSAARQWRTLH
jgi:hypothetical protein